MTKTLLSGNNLARPLIGRESQDIFQAIVFAQISVIKLHIQKPKNTKKEFKEGLSL